MALAQLDWIGGGDGGVDMINPDAKYEGISVAASGTADIAVTQMPRLIMFMYQSSKNSNYFSAIGIIDVKNSKAKRAGHFSSGIGNWQDWSQTSVNNYFTITSSSVSFNKTVIGATMDLFIYVYY